MVYFVNSHTNATSKRWQLWEIDLRFALNSTSCWVFDQFCLRLAIRHRAIWNTIRQSSPDSGLGSNSFCRDSKLADGLIVFQIAKKNWSHDKMSCCLLARERQREWAHAEGGLPAARSLASHSHRTRPQRSAFTQYRVGFELKRG